MLPNGPVAVQQPAMEVPQSQVAPPQDSISALPPQAPVRAQNSAGRDHRARRLPCRSCPRPCHKPLPKELWDIRLRSAPFARARHGVTTDKHSRALPPIVPRKDVYPEGTRKSPWIRRVFDVSGRSGCAARNWPGRDRSSCHTSAQPGVQERSFRFYTFPVRIYRHRQIRDIQSTTHGILHRILCAPGGAVKGGDQQ